MKNENFNASYILWITVDAAGLHYLLIFPIFCGLIGRDVNISLQNIVSEGKHMKGRKSTSALQNITCGCKSLDN